VDAHTFIKGAEKFKQMSACQTADGKSFLEQERGVDATKGHNNVRSVSSVNTKRTEHGTWNADIECSAPP
jgi:hypothetical protein